MIDVDFEHTDKPVAKHIADWVADLERARRSPEYIRKANSRVSRLQRELRWTNLSSIRPDRLTEWLAVQQRADLGERTVNHYIEAATAFCNWCVAHGGSKTTRCDSSRRPGSSSLVVDDDPRRPKNSSG